MATHYSTSGVSIPGLGSDKTNFEDMIKKLKKVETRHAMQLVRWREDWNKRLDGFGQLREQLASLSSLLKTMNSEEKFLTKSVSSTDPRVATAIAEPGAPEGLYRLKIDQVATNSYASLQTTYTNKFDSINNSGGNQEFSYTYKGVTRNLNIPNGTNLEGLKNIINKDGGNPGVRAMLVEDGGQILVQLYSVEQGAGTDITINATGNDLAGFAPSGWQLEAGQNAKIRINNYPSSGWLEKTSNKVQLAENLYVNLIETGDVTISVKSDTSKMKENVEKFVESMNAIRINLNLMTSVDENKAVTDLEWAESLFEMQKGSILTGNYGVQLIASKLKSVTMDQAPGFEYFKWIDQSLGVFTGDRYSSLAHLGIKTDTQQGSKTFGLLIFETDPAMTTLESALRDNPEAVAELFAANKKGYTDSADVGVNSVMGRTKPGKYDFSYSVDAGGNVINAVVNGKPAKYDPVTRQLTVVNTPGHTEPNDADGLCLDVYSTTPGGSYSGTVRIKQGKLSALTDLIDIEILEPDSGPTDELKGTLSVLETQYKTIINNIDDKLTKEEIRVQKWEYNIKMRFARLDATLKYYDNMNKMVEQQIKSLDSSGK